MLRTLVHYALHFIAPAAFAPLFPREHRQRAWLLMLIANLVDLDHLLATPIFDPARLSLGFHPLHSYPAIALYILLAILPYGWLRIPWWVRPLAIGLCWHMAVDWQDYYLW